MSPNRLLLPLFAGLPMFAQTAREEMVTMRDGVHLATNIYLPPSEGLWPVVLTRTLCGKDMIYGPQAHKDGPRLLSLMLGHKIEVLVQSTNSPRLDVYSSTWEPVRSYDQAVKATNTVVVDGRSRIVLPVTKICSREAGGASQ